MHIRGGEQVEGSNKGVSNCYVFKSRLQEFAQKVGLPTPVYETIKEGPSHEPTFRSTVIVNNVRYDSLPGFYNRKAAEQSAAEVALLSLNQLGGTMAECISQPVHETGLCKNLLQEYAQKMNYAIPIYECLKGETPGRASLFSCTVEIGGIRYIGAAARTKKEAEIKAARTALLAIQANASDYNDNSMHTVIPFKKKVAELGINSQETAAAVKPKKRRFKKKSRKKKHATGEGNHVETQNIASLALHMGDQLGPGRADGSVSNDSGVPPVAVADPRYGRFFNEIVGTALAPCKNGDINLLNHGGGSNGLIKEGNEIPGVEQSTSTDD